MPPLPFTVSAQSWYPRIAAFPGSEKSPVCDREIPITIGAVEALPLTLLEELAPLLLEHAHRAGGVEDAQRDEVVRGNDRGGPRGVAEDRGGSLAPCLDRESPGLGRRPGLQPADTQGLPEPFGPARTRGRDRGTADVTD